MNQNQSYITSRCTPHENISGNVSMVVFLAVGNRFRGLSGNLSITTIGFWLQFGWQRHESNKHFAVTYQNLITNACHGFDITHTGQWTKLSTRFYPYQKLSHYLYNVSSFYLNTILIKIKIVSLRKNYFQKFIEILR